MKDVINSLYGLTAGDMSSGGLRTIFLPGPDTLASDDFIFKLYISKAIVLWPMLSGFSHTHNP
ncbi:MAG: hypothetical protein KDC85_19210 [Saprospiraceae bacterium]|nr:hypothetical protein [Saprospiraceae bacterium]MCB9324506.1 hypothetical protein [Lewinellaceae bacterium]